MKLPAGHVWQLEGNSATRGNCYSFLSFGRCGESFNVPKVKLPNFLVHFQDTFWGITRGSWCGQPK